MYPPLPRSETPNLIMTLPPELRNEIYSMLLREPRHLRLNPWLRHVYREINREINEEEERLGGILMASKQIRKEALPIYYGINEFLVTLDLTDLSRVGALSDWLTNVVRLCGKRPFASFNVYKYNPSRRVPNRNALVSHIRAFRPFVDAMYHTGAELDYNTFSTFTQQDNAKVGTLPGHEDLSRAGEIYISHLAEEAPKSRAAAVTMSDVRYHRNYFFLRGRGVAPFVQTLHLGKRAHDMGWTSGTLDARYEEFAMSWSDDKIFEVVQMHAVDWREIRLLSVRDG